jgi:phage repressor protein C with HTH and peptisase S24 domain
MTKECPVFTHGQIWAAIDALAQRRGWSVGRLAVRAGLDATALNPCKRTGVGAKPRWPSTETLCKLLSASQTSFTAFAQLIDRAAEDGEPDWCTKKPRRLMTLLGAKDRAARRIPRR